MISLIINIANDSTIQALGFGTALLVVFAYLIAMLIVMSWRTATLLFGMEIRLLSFWEDFRQILSSILIWWDF